MKKYRFILTQWKVGNGKEFLCTIQRKILWFWVDVCDNAATLNSIKEVDKFISDFIEEKKVDVNKIIYKTATI